jgi:hypothetical protein
MNLKSLNWFIYSVGLCLLIYYLIISLNFVQWGDSGYYINRIIKGPLILKSLQPLSHHFYQFFLKLFFLLFGIKAIFIFNILVLGFSLFLMIKIAERLNNKTIVDMRFLLGFLLLHAVVWTVTHVEVYQFHLLLILLGLYFIFDPNQKGFLISGVFWGLSLAVHQMSVLAFPILIFWLLKHFKYSKFLYFAMGTCFGLLILLPAFIENFNFGLLSEIRFFFTGASKNNTGWENSLFSVNAFNISSIVFIFVALGSILNPATYLFFYQIRKVKSPQFFLINALCVVFLVFSISYNVSDRFTFLLPFLTLSTVISMVMDERPKLFSNIFLLVNYTIPILFFSFVYLFKPQFDSKKYELKNFELRDEFKFYGLPWINDNSANSFAENYMNSLEQVHPIYSDYNINSCLNTFILRNPRFDSYILVKSSRELKTISDSVVYIPRLNFIDTNVVQSKSSLRYGYKVLLKPRI